jgi:hypothetical protein
VGRRWGGVVRTAMKQRALDWQMRLSGQEVTEGDSIDVTIEAAAHSEIAVRGGEVLLARTVTYRYRHINAFGGSYAVPARSTDIVGRVSIPVTGSLLTGEHVVHRVAVPVPADSPGTVSAALVDIQWAVTARIDVEGEPVFETTQPVTVRSRARNRSSVEQKPPTVADRGGVVLGFESLSDRHIAPGSQLSGGLTVVTDRPVAARGLRVELVLRENVHHGPWIGGDPAHNPSDQDKESETVVAAVVPAGGVEFRPAQLHRFPFSITVPAQLAGPSLQTPEFTLTWILRGVLDRAWRQDPTVEIELHGVTTPE